MFSPHLREFGQHRWSSSCSGTVAATDDIVSSSAANNSITVPVAAAIIIPTAATTTNTTAGNHWRQRDGNDRRGCDTTSLCCSYCGDWIRNSSAFSSVSIAITSSI